MLFLIPPPSSLSPLSQLCPSPPCDGRTGGGPQCLGLRWGRHGVRFHGNSQSGIVTWSSSIYGVSKSVIYVCWWYLVSSHYWRNGGRGEEGMEERKRKRMEGERRRRGRETGEMGARWLFILTCHSQFHASLWVLGGGWRVWPWRMGQRWRPRSFCQMPHQRSPSWTSFQRQERQSDSKFIASSFLVIVSLNTCIELGLFLSLQAAKAGQGPGNVAYKLTYMHMFQGMRLKLSYHGNELHDCHKGSMGMGVASLGMGQPQY